VPQKYAAAFRSTMALPALSNGVTLPAKLWELGIAGKVACAILRIPSSRLSLCISGVQDLSAKDAVALHALLKTLSEIQRAIPFPLSFKDAEKWRDILDRMENENISIENIGAAMERIFKS
jgi:hypothetical protein